MSAGSQFKALYDFTASRKGMLSFKSGEQFTLVSKSNADWWTMRSPSGETGLVPVTYVGECKVRPEGAVTKSVVYIALYDYSAQADNQLSFKQRETLYLLDKTDVSWWSMRSQSGGQGLVPVNYIDKVDTNQKQEGSEKVDGHTPSPTANGDMDNGALSEVLKSIDSNIQRIHEAAAAQGGLYSHDQRATLEKLVAHRQSVVGSSPSPSHHGTVQNHIETQRHHTISSPASSSGWSNGGTSMMTSPSSAMTSSPTKSSSSANSSPKREKRTYSTNNSSPRPRRHAPPPPSGVTPASVGGASMVRKNKSKALKDNRYSLQVDLRDLHDHHQPNFGSLPRRSGPTPPTRQESIPESSRSGSTKPPLHPSVSLGSSVTSLQDARLAGYSSFVSPPHQTSSSSLQPVSTTPSRRYSSDGAVQSATPPDARRSSVDVNVRNGSNSSVKSQQPQQSPTQQNTDGRYQRAHSTSSTGSHGSVNAAPATSNSPRSNSHRSSSSPSSPRKNRSRSGSNERDVYPYDPSGRGGVSAVGPPPVVKLDLPMSFSQSEGMELVEAVRKKTGVSHRKSIVAINEVLEFLKTHVPLCGEMVDGLLSAVHETQQTQMSPSTARKMEKTSDVERLKEIFFEITECKDDSQQRGWAVHDDQQAIVEILEELLQILCDANPEATKLVVQEDKYENILTLIVYYQMESRMPIRLLLLKVFGVLCGLDSTVIGVLLTSVLPNELGRDIQQGLTDIQKTLYSSTVCTMIFSMSEAVPLPVYDQWSEEYVLFLLDCIEDPPEEDEEEQVPDAFINMILSFNQHFQDPATNLVMKALKQRPNPRNFSEKLMLVINRGEDPVAIAEPCCPDSMTKFLLDVFYDSSTSSMFYTTDLMVLIDIITRQLTDLSQGDEVRTHNLELLHRLVGSTPYSEHKHRQSALTVSLNRIAHEEGIEATPDFELVKKVWSSYPGLFEEVTDL